jgi:transglutaminase-like putative cysteine protease
MSFGCIAVGYLGILLADGLQTATRWTRGLSSDSADGGKGPTPVVWGSASYIGIPALVATIVLGAALPTLSLPGFGFGEGRGGSGPLQLSDPTLDLRRNLNQADDRTVLTYQTDAPGGVYLRMASLPRLSPSGWGNTEMDLTRGTELGAVPGLAAEPSRVRTTAISVQDFSAEYLPLPYAPRSFTATGEWAYDPTSMVVVANGGGNRRSAIRNLTYSVESVDIQPAAQDLARAVTGVPADSSVTAVFPAELPQGLVALSREVTKDANTPAEEAAAIQKFLRGSRFTYTTEPRPGSGYRALENFLLDDRKGYCEQFAGAMAMMARVVGIPSRVAVGFLPGERKGDVWEVSIHDMHAWPELYFSGYGWVRFEPTPSSVTGAPPDWTVGEALEAGEEPTTAPSATATEASPSTAPSASAAPSSRPVDVATDTGVPTARTLLTAATGLLALMVLAAPATIRVRRRSARMSAELAPQEQVESAWAEIRDSVVDYGGRWPDGSPRTIGSEIGERLPPSQSDAMSAVATLVERSRYARSLPYSDTLQRLPVLTSEIRRGLAEPRGFWSRLRAVVLPRSLFRRVRR